MFRVRNQWPFGVDLCCLPPEENSNKIRHNLPSSSPTPRALFMLRTVTSRSAADARHFARRRLGGTIGGPADTKKSPYSLMHFFNKPFRSRVCAINASGYQEQRARFYTKVRAYHEDVVRSLRNDAGATDLALVPSALQRAKCIAHSSAEEACARTYLLSCNHPALTALAAAPLERFYSWLVPFQSCRRHTSSRTHRSISYHYCPEDAHSVRQIGSKALERLG